MSNTVTEVSTPLKRHSEDRASLKSLGIGKDVGRVYLRDSEAVEMTPIPMGTSSSGLGDTISTNARSSLPPKTKVQRKKARIHYVACCMALFLAGWNDGSTGPLLPRIQKVYGIGFAVVSIMFIFACIGFVSGALVNVPMSDRLGFGKVRLVIPLFAAGALVQVVAYAILAPAPPFPVLVFSYMINGIGIALQDAQANGFVASIKENPETKMGILHAVYGLGALSSPLVATQFAQLERWSFHYLISLGIAVVNAATLAAVFRFKTQDACLVEIGEIPEEKGTSEQSTFRQILGLKAVHLLAAFILVYVGVEVTIGGWIVTFMIDVRGGGPSAGYVSSGFFGGLTFGRVALLWVNQKVGERTVLFIYTALAIALELVVWLVPSLIGGAVAVSFVGVLLGPMYPLAMNQTRRILPGWLLTGSIGWIASFGQAGSAILPFITGAISQKRGIKSLQPLLVAMMSLMLVLWALVPKSSRRLD